MIASATLAASVWLGACGGGEERERVSFNLTIGNLIPLTGALGDFGPSARKAGDLALLRINDAVEDVGDHQRVAVRQADDGTDPRAGLRAARRLVDADDATCLVGPWAVRVATRVANRVSIPRKVLQISPTPSFEAITNLRDDGLVNSTALPDAAQGRALAEAAARGLGGAAGKTINIGARRDSYGTEHADVFEEAWTGKGGEIGEKVTYDPGQRSFRATAATITAGSPDAFAIVDFPESFYSLAPALLRTRRWDPGKTFVTDGLAADAIPREVGERATEGMRGTIPGAPDEGAAAEAFDELYSSSTPRNIGRTAFDAQSFDAVILCYLAAVAAGGARGPAMADEVRNVSAPPGDKFDWQQLPDAVKALENGDDIDYEGASGPIDMNQAGDATAGVYDVFRYRRGRVDVFDEVAIVERDGE